MMSQRDFNKIAETLANVKANNSTYERGVQLAIDALERMFMFTYSNFCVTDFSLEFYKTQGFEVVKKLPEVYILLHPDNLSSPISIPRS